MSTIGSKIIPTSRQRSEGASDAPRLLVVCTGNVCRSPIAAAVFLSLLGDRGPAVRSAGTHALEGSGVPGPGLDLVAARGGPDAAAIARRHRATGLTVDELAATGLVLTATREQRARAARLLPAAARSTFTLREAARLAPAVPAAELPATGPERLEALTAHLRRLRGTRRAAVPDDDDVVDPFGGPPDLWRRCADQLWPAVETLAAVLRPSTDRPPARPGTIPPPTDDKVGGGL